MVAVVAGNGFGILRSSAAVVGGAGQLGTAQMGRGNDRVYANAANGNLTVDRTDEVLTGVGADEPTALPTTAKTARRSPARRWRGTSAATGASSTSRAP